MEEQNISNSWEEAGFGNNELNQLVGVTGEEPVDNSWSNTGFGKAKQLVRVGVSGTEHFDNIDYFWDHAYQKINTISVSSGILFFIIFYLIATYIKYNIKHTKEKSLTYKQVLKDSTIIIIAIDLSVIVALLTYNHIDWMNPKPAPIAIPLSEALYNFGIIVLIIGGLLTVTIKIILHNRKGKHQ